jgi:hypothetical protein
VWRAERDGPPLHAIGGTLRDKEGKLLSAKAAFAVAVILASLPALASCGGNARSADGTDGSRADARAVAEQTTGEMAVVETMSGRGAAARAGDAVARAGDGAFARAGDVVARAGAGAAAGAAAGAGDAEARADADREDTSRKVALEIRGDRGTKFSGKCSIGGDERRIGGRVPERYSYELDGEKLECEIRKDGPGTLEVVLAAGDDVRSVHRQTGAGSSTINLTYSGNGASSSTSQVGSIVSTAVSSTESR